MILCCCSNYITMRQLAPLCGHAPCYVCSCHLWYAEHYIYRPEYIKQIYMFHQNDTEKLNEVALT